MSVAFKQARALTRTRFAEMCNSTIFKTRSELEDVLQNPDSNAMELMIARVIKETITLGDASKLAFVLDRLIGKVPEHTNIALEDKRKELLTMSRPELLERAKFLVGVMEEEIKNE